MAKVTKKHRKHGRNKKWCEAYRLRRQAEKNQVKVLRKHVARFPGDRRAADRLKILLILV